jgi:hypothetical protein
MADRDSLLDDLLSSSRPPVTALTPDIEDELARMSVMSRTDNRKPRGHRHISRAAALGVCTALVLGGAGAAAAATFTGWPWWKQEPPAPFSYTLPSGAVCETTDRKRPGTVTRGQYGDAGVPGIRGHLRNPRRRC